MTRFSLGGCGKWFLRLRTRRLFQRPGRQTSGGFGPSSIHWLSVLFKGEFGLRAGEEEGRGTEGQNLSVQPSEAILFRCKTKEGLYSVALVRKGRDVVEGQVEALWPKSCGVGLGGSHILIPGGTLDALITHFRWAPLGCTAALGLPAVCPWANKNTSLGPFLSSNM